MPEEDRRLPGEGAPDVRADDLWAGSEDADAILGDADGQLPVAHVVTSEGQLVPGRIWDPNIRAFLIAKVHEVRHRTGYWIKRIMYALEAEGRHISRQTCWRFLHMPCDQCNGDTLNPADFHGRG